MEDADCAGTDKNYTICRLTPFKANVTFQISMLLKSQSKPGLVCYMPVSSSHAVICQNSQSLLGQEHIPCNHYAIISITQPLPSLQIGIQQKTIKVVYR